MATCISPRNAPLLPSLPANLLKTYTKTSLLRLLAAPPPLPAPRKIFAMNTPPGLSTCVTMVSAARISCACTYSSRSCRPVTSGAPSHTTRSAWWPSKWEMTADAVSSLVMSPCRESGGRGGGGGGGAVGCVVCGGAAAKWALGVRETHKRSRNVRPYGLRSMWDHTVSTHICRSTRILKFCLFEATLFPRGKVCVSHM